MNLERIARHIESLEPRTRPAAVARSALALGQLCVLGANSDGALFGSTAGPRQGCSGIATAALWCASGTSQVGLDVARALAIAALCVVAAGYRPAWSCVPHWYVSVSMSTCIASANGGEFVAQTAALLLLPVYLGDSRRWQWSSPSGPLAPRWAGRSAAALLALRWQVALIYVEAAFSKLSNPAWRDGRALPGVFLDSQFGLPDFAKPLSEFAASSGPSMRVLGWAVVATELLIAAFFVGPVRRRRIGVLLVIALHTGIAVLMGLVPFGVAMGAVAMSAASESRSGPRAADCADCPVPVAGVEDPLPAALTPET